MTTATPTYRVNYDGQCHTMTGLYGEDIMCRRAWSKGRFSEDDLLAYLAGLGRAGVYVDAGANLGNHSVFFMHHCPADRVLAVEAHPAIYRALCGNLLANAAHAKGVTYRAINAALSDVGSGLAVLSRIKPANVGRTRVLAVADSLIDPADAVAVTRVDDLAGGADVGLIKVDCEGMDLRVLAGSALTIERCRPVVVAEAADAAELAALDSLMAAWPYRRTFRDRKTPHSYVWEPK